MREKLKPLYELQCIDLEIARAEKAKAGLDNGAAKRAQVEAVRQKYQAADKLLHEATTEQQDKELTLKSVETKQKQYREKLYSGKVSNPKELESMEKEIEMLGRQKDKLEERILELMDIIEDRKATAESAKKTLDKYEAALAADAEKTRQEAASLTAKIQELSSEREKALPAVDPVMLKRYDSLRARLGGMVVSKIQESNCTACHTQVTSGQMNVVRDDKDMETCENCSRILYLE